MIDLSDLIGTPYKEHGRNKDGVDCYGLAIAALERYGYRLDDVVYDNHDVSLADKYKPTLNVEPLTEPQEGAIIEMTAENGNLHIGVCVNKKEFIHATKNGVRINRIGCLPVRGFYGCTVHI